MELLNLQFVILLIKVAISVMPCALGVAILLSTEESRLSLRNKFCNKLFGVNGAIPYVKFSRFLVTVAVLALLFSGVATWFLLLRGFFE